MKEAEERWIDSESVFKGRILSVRTGRAQLHDGSLVQREVMEHPGGVAVVPLLNDNTVILIRQFRISVGREILELPGGRVEPGDTDLQQRAQTELEEETGFQAGCMHLLASFLSCPGISNLRIHLYLATSLTQPIHHLTPEGDENITVVKMPLLEVRNMLESGAFEDGQTIMGLSLMFAHLDRQKDVAA